MEKIRLLAISPYLGMGNMIENICRTRDDILLTSRIGDLDEGVTVISELSEDNFDAILSRGGTAEMLRSVSKLPVMEIALSHYDILSSIKLAQNYTGHFAIIGFPSISNFARMLCDILDYKIDIFTINNREEAESLLLELKEKGCTMILGDMITSTLAKQSGLNSVLITSGSESIASALDQVVHFCHYHRELKNESYFYSHAFRLNNQQLLVYNAKGGFEFASCEYRNQALFTMAKKMVPNVMSHGRQTQLKSVGKKHMSITGIKMITKSNVYAFFYLAESERIPMADDFQIVLKNKDDVAYQFFNVFYSGTANQELNRQTTQYSQSDAPLLIIGEKGTGKEKMGTLIYSRSRYRNAPLYIMDCTILTDKSWNHLLHHPSSPLFETDHTLFFKDIGVLKSNWLNELMAFITHAKLHQRSRIIFSLSSEINSARELPLCLRLKNVLGCFTLELLPLRQRIHDIPSLSTLYLNELNMNNARQIAGFEPEAMSLIQGFDWEHNLGQFKRVLGELATLTDTPYISAKHVREILKREKKDCLHLAKKFEEIDFNQSLAEITHDIVLAVLSEENFNQTKTAKRLGISRSTLWRLLNR